MTKEEMIILPIAGVILLLQSTYLFIDARKRDSNPWFWGLWGLIQCPFPLLFYFIIVRKIFHRKKDDPA